MVIMQLVLQFIIDEIFSELRSSYSDAHKDLHGCRGVPATDNYEELLSSFNRLCADLAEEIDRNKNMECPFERDDRLTAEAVKQATTPTKGETLASIWPTK